MKRCLFLLLLTGCSTIHFDNGPALEEASPSGSSSWHHVALLDFLELSEPFNLAKACGDSGWSSVTVERGILQSIVSLVGIYTPWDVEYSCNEKGRVGRRWRKF